MLIALGDIPRDARGTPKLQERNRTINLGRTEMAYYDRSGERRAADRRRMYANYANYGNYEKNAQYSGPERRAGDRRTGQERRST
jgi:hypothetical protein